MSEEAADTGDAIEAITEAVEGAEGADTGEGTGESGEGQAAASAPKSEPKKLTAQELLEQYGDVNVTVKVNGREMSVPLKDLPQGYTLRKAALQKMDEAARVKREAEQAKDSFFSELKDSGKLRELIRKHGHDEVKLAYDIVREQMEIEKMSPREQAEYWRKREEEKLETKRQKEQREAEEKQSRERAKEQADKLKAQLPGVLEKAGLPNSPQVVQRLVSVMRRAGQAGYQMSLEDGAAAAKEELMEEQRTLVSEMSGAQIADWLGQDLMKKIRRYEVDRIKGKTQAPQQQAQQRPKTAPKKPQANGAAPSPYGSKTLSELMDEM